MTVASREDLYYLPPELPEREWACQAEIPNGRPADPDECGQPTDAGEVLCPHHQTTLPDDEQEAYERHHADDAA